MGQEIIWIPLEEQRLLWASIVWVSLKYHSETLAAQARRPQRTYETDDGKRIGGLIKTIRKIYGANQHSGHLADFQAIKSKVLVKECEAGLSLEKRNFYSSVIATFFSWHYHGTPASRAILANLIASFPPPPKNPKRFEEQ